MRESTVDAVWEYLEQLIGQILDGEVQGIEAVEGTLAGIQLLLENRPADIVDRIERSPLPTRAVVSWLVFEARKVAEIPDQQVQALADYWQDNAPAGQDLIRPPAGRT